VGIELGSENGLTLWMNDKQILATGGTAAAAAHAAIAYDHYGVAEVNPGVNLLIAKIDRKGNGGNVIMKHHRRRYIKRCVRTKSSENINSEYLSTCGEPIHLILPLACLGQAVF